MLIRRKKETNVNAYIKFIEKIIYDKNIKDEIIGEIEKFSKDGIVAIDGNNLSGKILDSEGNLYIDIKYDNGKFICLYTKWDLDSVVVIEKETLNGGNYKLTKTDKVKYKTHNNENKYDIEAEEWIYNLDNKLLYKSKAEIEENFNSYKEQLVYRDDSPFINVVSTEKDWYISNGSIIKYKMNKNEMHSKKEIEEEYLICKKTYKDEFGTTCCFIDLGIELFVELMTGKMTIEEVLVKLNKKEPVKKIGEKNGKNSD